MVRRLTATCHFLLSLTRWQCIIVRMGSKVWTTPSVWGMCLLKSIWRKFIGEPTNCGEKSVRRSIQSKSTSNTLQRWLPTLEWLEEYPRINHSPPTSFFGWHGRISSYNHLWVLNVSDFSQEKLPLPNTYSPNDIHSTYVSIHGGLGWFNHQCYLLKFSWRLIKLIFV